MNFSEINIINPKRKKQTTSAWDEFFPYYAGYPDAFARSVLSTAKLDPKSIIFDPWNGSGTTTYAASQMGFAAIGLDLNPVMVIVARSRMLSASEADSLVPLSAEILRRSNNQAIQCNSDDPLLWWFRTDTANCIRSIETSIRTTLVGDLTLTQNGVNFDRISSLASSFYVALFNLAKELAASFQSSNPTWLRKPKADEEKVFSCREDITKRFSTKIERMAEALAAKADLLFTEPMPVSARMFDSTKDFKLDKPVDFVLTSPPYCTRIDYTAATRMQLAILDPLVNFEIEVLSRNMIGSVKVPREVAAINEDWGSKCTEFLSKVKDHQSHASAGYYLKTHVDYFTKISKSIFNISVSLRDGGAAILVVQDSHYKEIHNDVPTIISEIADRHSLKLQRRDDFQVKNSMSGINPRARAYNKHSKIVESVLCFQKVSK